MLEVVSRCCAHCTGPFSSVTDVMLASVTLQANAPGEGATLRACKVSLKADRHGCFYLKFWK